MIPRQSSCITKRNMQNYSSLRFTDFLVVHDDFPMAHVKFPYACSEI